MKPFFISLVFVAILFVSPLKLIQSQTISGPDLDGDLIFLIDSATTNNQAYIYCYIRVNNGNWNTDIYTTAVRHNKVVHQSELLSVSGDTNQFQLEINVYIPNDEWGYGEMEGSYTINIDKHNDSITGSYSGTVEDYSFDPGTHQKSGPVSGHYYTRKLPASVDNWDAPQPGEHPRLFFREGDLGELRTKSQTSGGQVIMDTLKSMLKNGPYTLWDGAGYGFLFQITGDTAYADSGRASVEKALNGQPDKDDRYSFVDPGGALRAGPSVAAIAMAYDLCYDGWPKDFRDSVAQEIQNYKGDGSVETYLSDMALDPRHQPGSNHWGAIVGGAGISVLAIMNDPDTDSALLAQYLRNIRLSALRNLYEGFGDGGYFAEHAGPSHVASNTAFVPYLQAEKLAGGKDFMTRPNAKWISLRWAHELIPSGDEAIYPIRIRDGCNGCYGDGTFNEDGTSHGGQFAQGMGTVSGKEKRAMAWVYENIVHKDTSTHYYGVGTYPHRAMFALINWPLNEKPLHPEGIIPHLRRDNIFGYTSFRKEWDDHNDIIITSLTDFNYKYGFIGKEGTNEPIMVWGNGIRTTGPATFFMEETVYLKTYNNGSGVVSTLPAYHGIPTRIDDQAEITSFAVDFFEQYTGVPALIVATGPKAHEGTEATGNNGVTTASQTISTPKYTYHVMTMQSDKMPLITKNEDTLFVNDRKIWFDGKKIVLDVQMTNSVPLAKNKKDIRVYPSVTTGAIRIENVRNAQVDVYSVNGALKYSGRLEGSTINIGSFSSGMYILKIQTSSEIYTRKIIKQ